MPRIPTYDGPQLREAGIPNAFQDGINSSAPFGGAQAEQMSQAGKVMGAIAEQMERQAIRDDKAKADAAYVTLQNEYTSQSLNWKKDRVGAKADGLLDDADKWWAGAEQRYGQDLTDRQRAMLAEHARGLRTRSLADIGQYQETQKRDFANKSGLAFVQSQIQQAAENPGLNAAAARTTIRDKLIELGNLNGWGDEVTQQEIKRYSTTMHTEVIQSMIAANNPQEAQRYFEQARKLGDFDETKANDISDRIKKASDQKTATDLADSLSGRPLEEGLAEIAKTKDPEIRKMARQQFLLNQKDEDLITQAKERKASDTVWQDIANGRKPRQADLDSMNGRERIQVNQYYEARAKATAAADGRLHAKEDNYEALDIVETAMKQGDITDPKQLERYAPFLRAETFRTLRKSLEKRGDVPRGEVEKVFLDRVGKTKAKLSDDERKQWIAFQDYINTNVRETKRPEDLEVWADRWFMKGYGTEDSFFRPDPSTFGAARTKGRKDFLITTPETTRADVDGALATMRLAGVKTPTDATARDRFYTDFYLDASRWFAARGEAVSPPRAAAFALLKQNNKPVTPANINAVIGQLKGQGSAGSQQPAR